MDKKNVEHPDIQSAETGVQNPAPATVPVDDAQMAAQLEQMKQENLQVAQAIMAEPVLGEILSDVIGGLPFEVALAKHIDMEAIKPLEGEPNYDDFKSAATERKKRMEEAQKHKEEVDANVEKMKATVEEFFNEEGIDDQERDRYVDFVEGIISEALSANLSKKSFKKMLQAFRYDDDLVSAAEQARIDARNETIETRRQTNATSDGLPETGSNVVAQPEKPKKRIFNIE